MLTISNLYAHGYDPSQIERLRRLGFKFRKPASTFAGSQVLHFVDFSQMPALEFIHVEDEVEYLAFVPPGMVAYCPGISLLLSQDSKKNLKAYEEDTKVWGSNIHHVSDDDSGDPNKSGWRYLNFEEPVIQNTFIYLSSRIGPITAHSGPIDHSNHVIGVTDLVFDLDDGDLAKLAVLTETQMVSGAIELGGVRVGSRRVWAASIGLPEKQFPLAVVILQATNLEFFQDHDDVNMIEYRSKPAVHIPMNALSWDVIIAS